MIYELMYIIPSHHSDSEIDGIVASVTSTLEKHGAKLEKTDHIGKLKLAYPVKKVRHGTYILSYFDLEDGSAIQAIDTELKHMDEVLRHLFVKREDGIPTQPVEISSYQAPLNAEGKRADAPKKERPTHKPTPPAEKISADELDKKLDEILESDVTENV